MAKVFANPMAHSLAQQKEFVVSNCSEKIEDALRTSIVVRASIVSLYQDFGAGTSCLHPNPYSKPPLKTQGSTKKAFSLYISMTSSELQISQTWKAMESKRFQHICLKRMVRIFNTKKLYRNDT
jgi:hypothetical protein